MENPLKVLPDKLYLDPHPKLGRKGKWKHGARIWSRLFASVGTVHNVGCKGLKRSNCIYFYTLCTNEPVECILLFLLNFQRSRKYFSDDFRCEATYHGDIQRESSFSFQWIHFLKILIIVVIQFAGNILHHMNFSHKLFHMQHQISCKNLYHISFGT